ncbi:hypothetical protein [Streptomyces pseudogriseolus]|uniref:hypothetical protein n=1 Tax=Streptomyces pseudogriseolus TaxID=36817 RepID=UPI003FA3037F
MPENARTLVVETTGDKNQELPECTPQEGAYTLYATCEGKGKVSIVDRDSTNPHPVTRNRVHTVGVVYEDTLQFGFECLHPHRRVSRTARIDGTRHPTTSRPATEPDSRDNRYFRPDQQESHRSFEKRTTFEASLTRRCGS